MCGGTSTVKTVYDALGRVTQTIRQDGGIATVFYSGNCAITTDEAGKQRKSCSDALGRLTEVDEPGDSYGTAGTGAFTITGSLESVSGVGALGPVAATGQVQIQSVNANGGIPRSILPGSPARRCRSHVRSYGTGAR